MKHKAKMGYIADTDTLFLWEMVVWVMVSLEVIDQYAWSTS